MVNSDVFENCAARVLESVHCFQCQSITLVFSVLIVSAKFVQASKKLLTLSCKDPPRRLVTEHLIISKMKVPGNISLKPLENIV
uniref:Uncharacterized protein n=1 Tax=Arion vulgaris TaxID=1028688 RepID=A0A0B6ZEH8_9EUPU